MFGYSNEYTLVIVLYNNSGTKKFPTMIKMRRITFSFLFEPRKTNEESEDNPATLTRKCLKGVGLKIQKIMLGKRNTVKIKRYLYCFFL